MEIEDKKYAFRIFKAKNAIMEFGVFLPYSSLKDSEGPIERSLNEMIYPNIIDYERFFSENFCQLHQSPYQSPQFLRGDIFGPALSQDVGFPIRRLLRL